MQLTEKAVLEIIHHEGIVLEAYKDSVGVWTWAMGVTNASGHTVHPRYKDKPSTMQRALEVTVWLLRTRYLPAVLRAFKHELTEAQLAAALSFHWNTGAIERASWVKSWNEGHRERAKREFMNWRKPPEIIKRREAERDLFFEGKWKANGLVPVYGVAKPSYHPRGARLVDIREDIRKALL